MSKAVFTNYSVWERKSDGSIEPLDGLECAKSKALRILREFLPQYPHACLVKVVRTVCPNPRKGR